MTASDIPSLDRLASVHLAIVDYYDRHHDVESKQRWVNEFRQMINQVLLL